jgi:hypothetical protein
MTCHVSDQPDENDFSPRMYSGKRLRMRQMPVQADETELSAKERGH